jgi:alpha-1,3-rhamnosyl/mannosyltransferase
MRVLLDTTFALRGPSGTGVYVERLAAALRDEGVEVLEAADRARRAPGGGGRASARNLLHDAAWVQRDLRRRAREAGADVVHHPLPALIARAGAPQVVTVHDLAFDALPGAFDPRFAVYARRAHRRAARGADAVVCPSHATAAELDARWGVGATVVAHGPGQELPVVARGEPRHFLYVGDAEPRKDVAVLLAAHARYRATARAPLPLVLAGTATAVDSGVRVAGRPDADALAELHAHAAALVHPSRHEGFGLTVLEALAAGTPVIAADTPAVREVAGAHARYVGPGDVDALARALHDPPAAPPPDAAARFSWRRCAREHVAVYERACRARPRRDVVRWAHP